MTATRGRCCALCHTPGDFGPVDYAKPTSGLCPACLATGRRWTVDRTHTVRLLDTPDTMLTFTCPAWCTQTHAEDERGGMFASDFAHRGTEHALPVEGAGGYDEVLLVQVHQYPFGNDLRQPTAVLWPDLGMSEQRLGPDGLCALAERLHRYADELTGLSIELAHIRNRHPEDER